MSAPTPKPPTVAIELDALEADIEILNEAMIEVLDVAFCEPNAKAPLLAALQKIHEASYSLRTWIRAEATP